MPRRSRHSRPPLVVLFSAVDPTGGAGLLADARAVRAQSCAPLAVACGIAPQNATEVISFRSASAKDIQDQFAAVQDAPFAAVKIGALFSPAAVRAVAACLSRINAPVVWDPVLAPTRGPRFADDETRNAGKTLILPRAAVATPNLREARALVGGNNITGPTLVAKKLIAMGAKNVVITTSERRRVRGVLYSGKKSAPEWQMECERVNGQYHGTGCCFSATLAARIAQGDSVPAAAARAHEETLAAIARAVSYPALGKQKLLALR